MNTHNYIVKSLEAHLFSGRIMKEHSLFLMAGFTPVNASFSKQAEYFRDEFEKLLCEAIALSNGIVSQQVIDADELVTDFTLRAEKQTERFTGIPIDTEITEKELRLTGSCRQMNIDSQMYRQVQQLNRKAIKLLDGLIGLKEDILKKVLSCEMFTANYPLLIEHITREAKLYLEDVMMLERQGYLPQTSSDEVECFWNRIMMEHALFIRGLLDPTEEELIETADDFAKKYSKLLKDCKYTRRDRMSREDSRLDSLEETLKFRDFKMAGAKGIQQCEIRSVILPLLADHVLREANHYIRLLE